MTSKLTYVAKVTLPAALIATVTLYLGLSLLAIKTDQGLYADGALFAFAATLAEPWHLVLGDFPARGGALLVTVGPAFLAHYLGFSAASSVGTIYQIAWFGFPVVSLGLAWMALPDGKKDRIAYPLLFWVALCLPTFSFPTETTVMAAVFWPLLLGALYPHPNKWHLGLRVTLSLIFCFSHETMVLSLPVLLLATAAREREPRHRLILLGVLIAGTAAVAAVIFFFHPENPFLVKALTENKRSLFNPVIFVLFKMIPMGAICLTAFVFASIKPTVYATTALAIFLIVVVTCFTVLSISPSEIHAGYHYGARTGIAFGLPCFAAAILWLEWTHHPLARIPAAMTLTALVISHAVYQTEFNRHWNLYRATFLKDLEVAAGREPLIPLAKSGVQKLANKKHPAGRFLWPWSAPYLSAMLPTKTGQPRESVLVEDPPGYIPVPCFKAQRMATQAPLVTEKAIQALIDKYCSVNPL